MDFKGGALQDIDQNNSAKYFHKKANKSYPYLFLRKTESALIFFHNFSWTIDKCNQPLNMFNVSLYPVLETLYWIGEAEKMKARRNQ